MSTDDIVEVDASELDSAPVGSELTAADYLLLLVLGLIIPVLILLWGWL